jgi:ribosomal protein L37AE/L43A
MIKDKIAKHHLDRLKAGTINKHSVKDLPKWISENTFINGDHYSFVDHEYQSKIALDPSQEVYVKKCSQVGLSELAARLAIALCAVHPHYTVAYTLPTAGFAGTFMRTRIDPIIEGSPYLKDLIHTSTDNAEIKRFGDSFLYLKGSQSTNAPISVPCDHLMHDELDFSDPEVISQYQSRLSHSKFRRKHKWSTPTIPDRGIDREFNRSRRHFNLVKCNHCNHYFRPDFFENVVIPGHVGLDLRKITKDNLHKYRHNEAYLACPKCGKEASLQIEHREWVCENPNDNYVGAGYTVTPFDAPNIIQIGYLIESSTQYKRYIDFQNFGLGMAAEDKESSLGKDELKALIVPQDVVRSYGSYVMGLDMGMTCHCLIGFVSADGALIIVHAERIPVGQVRVRRRELASLYRVRMTVVDSLPYTETVLAMQAEDQNLFGAIYVREKGLELYKLKDQEEEGEEGKSEVRQVNINRDKAFDTLMETLRAKMIWKTTDEEDEAWKTQCCDMKRVQQWTVDQEFSFVWKKSEDGNDHYHHATMYMWIASFLLGVSVANIALPFAMQTYAMGGPDSKEKPTDSLTNFFGPRK